MERKATAVVYYPPKEGCPYLAVIIRDGKILACEAVKSLTEGEALLKVTMEQLPRLIRQAKREKEDIDV
jgi:hypothetical protein